MDDFRVGRAVRALRRRRGLRQSDVAEAAGVVHDTVSRIELGRLDGVTLGTLRQVLRVVGAGMRIEVLWRGAALDRLLDERHAALVGAAAKRLGRAAWEVEAEVSFAVYGERGAIDLLGWHAASRSLLVVEVKTELVSVEETLRRLDAKARLARRIAAERFGWRPQSVARLLVLPAGSVERARVARNAAVLDIAFPMRGSAVRRWLAQPNGATSGLVFLPLADEVRRKCKTPPPQRVRRASAAGH